LPSSSKASPATVSKAIQLLYSAYRRDDFADPEGFVTQLGVILSDFPEEVVTYVTNPRTGLQRRSKWPPTISEVLEACEGHQLHLERIRKYRPAVVAERLPAPPPGQQGSLASIFVPKEHARYPGLVAWTEAADPMFWKFDKSSDGRQGIWVSHDAWERK
jgi:hypothetical protein